jgi:hypothetical protein
VPLHAPAPIRLPDQVWHDPAVLDLCRCRDANGLFRLAKKYGTSNEAIGYWTGIDPGEISKRLTGKMTGRPIITLDRWTRIANALDMPDHARVALGLAPKGSVDARTSDDANVPRRAVLRGAVVGLALSAVVDQVAGPGGAREASGGSGDSPGLMERGCAEWLAWQMWQRRTDELPVAELPAPIARYLNVGLGQVRTRLLSPGGLIACATDGAVTFVRPGDADFFVGHRVFRDIAGGSSRLLAAGQTTHQTDLVVQQYVAQHDASIRMLRQWSQRSTDSLVRVNSGGILAKLGRDDLVDEVAVSLAEHPGARSLYITAVLSRVLGRSWPDAEALAAQLNDREALSAALSADDLARMASELTNTRDGVARWCSAVVLGAVGAPSDSVRSALHRALMTERSRENLRAIGRALSGSTPVAG